MNYLFRSLLVGPKDPRAVVLKIGLENHVARKKKHLLMDSVSNACEIPTVCEKPDVRRTRNLVPF